MKYVKYTNPAKTYYNSQTKLGYPIVQDLLYMSSMAKSVTRFICQECGAILPKWMGQCDVCRAWNSVVEEVVAKGVSKSPAIPDDFSKTSQFKRNKLTVLKLTIKLP